MKSVIIKRIYLLTKIIYKPLVLLGGYIIFAAAIGDDAQIYADLHTDKLIDPFIYLIKLLPFKDVFEAYKESMLVIPHSGVATAVTLFTAIPFIPILFGCITKGMGSYFMYCSQYFFVDYVYRDSGKFAYTEMGEGFFSLIIALAVRLAVAFALYEASPFILVVSWVWNVIQLLFFWPGRAKKAEASA